MKVNIRYEVRKLKSDECHFKEWVLNGFLEIRKIDKVIVSDSKREEIMNDIRLGISPTFKFATGGRVGYANAGAVMPGQPMQAAGPTDQGPTPEDMAGITYEELRARLPQEVGDDIVRLLANSAEALEDFAMIQTEQDINTFNKKYGVNLVLPSEG